MAEPTFIDLFSGAGLFSAGFCQAGFRPILAMDLSRDAVASYNRNVAPCAVAGSVAELRDIPEVDVLIAGPPCQGFSTLGRRDPLDARNDLCFAVLPWVDKCAPKIVVFENVPPFLKSAQWSELVRRLRDMGYRDTEAWVLDAVDYGTPQRRKRAFTIASRVGPVDRPPAHDQRISAGAAAFDPPIPAGDPMHYWPLPSELAGARIRNIPPGGDKRDLLANHPDLCPPSWAKLGNNTTDVWGRMDPDDASNTVRCTFQNPSKGRYIHPTEDRVISLREGARLQGVPDHWVFEGKPYPMARQIGNGVPVPLAQAVGSAISRRLASGASNEHSVAAPRHC